MERQQRNRHPRSQRKHITVGRTAAIIAKEDMTVKGSTVDAKDILLKAGNNIRILSSESKSTTIEDPKVKKE